VFGRELHSYVITDAIRDEKVLKFKVEYNDVRPQFKAIETEKDEKKLSAAENQQALLHPDRIREITPVHPEQFPAKDASPTSQRQGF
jgi:type I restriction enzyme R subunit